MKPRECAVEPEVLAAILESRWPEQTDAALRAHVAQCPSCSETSAIASLMEAAGAEERTHAQIPEAGRVWWRAQLRARPGAAKSAGRPITAAQVIAFSCAASLVGACFGATSTWFQVLVGGLVSSMNSLKVPQLGPSLTALLGQYGAWLAAGGAVLLVVPSAIYVAFLRD